MRDVSRSRFAVDFAIERNKLEKRIRELEKRNEQLAKKIATQRKLLAITGGANA